MFIQRPKKTDSEDELLVMQQTFLGSGKSCVAEKVTEKVPQNLQKPINKVKKTSIFAQRHLNSSLNKECCKSEKLKQDLNGNKLSWEKDTLLSKPMLQALPTTLEEPSITSTGEDVMNLFEKVIAEHSVDELLEEVKELKSRFGPETIAFLKNRSKPKLDEIGDSSTCKKAGQQLGEGHEVLTSLHENGNKGNVTNAGAEGTEFSSTNILQSKVSTRFGLHGEIVMDGNYSSELYHHEEEPERGGYTLQEIFLLIRSSFTQQQDFGLKMLSCIVKQAKLGCFHGRLSNGIIPVLVDGDVGLLVRAALDSSAQSVIISAVEFLHALLVNSEDESALDHVFTWFRGYEQPAMNATNEDLSLVDDVNANQTNENNSLKVEEVYKKDMVEGLLNMILLPRISYLLNFFRLQTSVMNNLLDIVIRIYRHHHLHHDHSDSLYTFNYQQLTESLVKDFLPLEDDCLTLTCGKTVLQSKVVRLLRVLASSDVNIANYVHKKYADNVFQYLQQDISNSSLYFESLRFFIVLLRYGLANEKFKLCKSFIVARLYAISKLPDEMYSTNEAPLLLSLVEAGINSSFEDNQNELHHLISPDESYREFSELVRLVITICKKCVNDFTSQYYLQKYSTSSVLASSLNCAATCFAKFHQKLATEASEFVAHTLEPCLHSVSFSRAAGFLRVNSSIITGAVQNESLGESCASFKSLESLWANPFHVFESLPDDRPPKTVTKKLVSSHLEVHRVALIPPTKSSTTAQFFSPSPLSPPNIKWHPVVDPLSTASFLVAITRLVLTLAEPCYDFRGILMKVLKHPEIQVYLSKFISASNTSALSRNWFSRFEAHFVYFLIRMSKQLIGSLEHKGHFSAVFYHKVALNLLTNLHQGDEAIASELIADVIFTKEFFSDVFDCPETNLTQNFQSTFFIDTKRSPLINFGSDIFNNLSNMGDAYVQLFFNEEDLASSRNLLAGCRMRCMMAGMCNKMVMRGDWLLEPLRHLYSLHNQSKKNPELYAVVKNLEELCSHSLRASLLFEKCRPEVLHQLPTQLKFSRLIQAVVAAGKELENGVTYSYLDQLMEVYIKGQKKHGRVEQAFLKELYDSFLEVYLHYLGGIPVFDVMVLLPLFMFDDDAGSLWQHMWLTKAEVARYLFLSLHQLPCDIKKLLNSKDGSNISLIKIFYHSLKIRWFTQTKTPIPYLIAIHYLNQFLFSSVEMTESDKRWRRFYAQDINNWEEPVKSHVLFYKQTDLECDVGFKLYEVLPDSRQKQLTKLIAII